MKSEHRHELETNSLARHLSKWIDSGMPYGQTAVWCVVGVLAAVAAWSWYDRSSASRDGRTWLDYNLAVEGRDRPNLDLLKKAADDHPGTAVGELSDLTWADGQLFQAADVYLNSKVVANELLDKAAEKYEAIIGSVRDPILLSRAHWGLGRVYELRADLEKAKSEYEKVDGPFAPLAEQRLEELKRNRASETLTWLASAELPRRPVPTGGGTPGVRPDFKADEFGMPTEGSGTDSSFDDLIKGLQVFGPEAPDRYAPPGDQPPPGVTDDTPPAGPELPMTDVPPAVETPAEEKPAEEKPAEEKPAAPPSEEAPSETPQP